MSYEELVYTSGGGALWEWIVLVSLAYAAELQALFCCWISHVHTGLVCLCGSDVLVGSGGVHPPPLAPGKPTRMG